MRTAFLSSLVPVVLLACFLSLRGRQTSGSVQAVSALQAAVQAMAGAVPSGEVRPIFAHCGYFCYGDSKEIGVHGLSQKALIRACGPIAIGQCPRVVHLEVKDIFIFGIGITLSTKIESCAN